MSKEAIMRVQEAEAEAAAIRAAAEQTAKERIEENEKRCAAEAEKAINGTDAVLRHKLETVRKRADALVEQSRQEAAEEMQTIETETRSRMKDAVKLIVWEIFDSCQ